MAIFRGLRVEIVRLRSIEGEVADQPCEEFQSIECDAKTIGNTCHQFISLEAGIFFGIKITVEDAFEWSNATGLQLHVDFDNGNRVYNAQIFITRHANDPVKSAIRLSCDPPNSTPKATIRSLTQLVTPFQEEQLSFQTVMLEDDFGKRGAKLHRHGQIWIAVTRCKLERRIGQSQIMGNLDTRTKQPSAQKLRNAGIYSRIEYSNVQRRPATAIDIKPSSQLHIGTFVFLYRIPEHFERIKKADEADNPCGNDKDSIPETLAVRNPLFRPESITAASPQTDHRQFPAESVGSPLFRLESVPAASPQTDRRLSPSESVDASTIVVQLPSSSTDGRAKPLPPLLPTLELTVEQVQQMHKEYESKATLYHRNKAELEAHYVAEEEKLRDVIADIERVSQDQKAEHQRIMQALETERQTLQARVEKQQSDFEADKMLLEEKIQTNKRVSEAFDACAAKRARLLQGDS